ncbi:hypothetical protein CC86DRAFT_432320 [Ophiobolus disseminans]|uniref:F-box domain-containing protein n=1 Tax=Ophiobolus disseminans TaxID=1469910 RepID=A0A6A6ZG07_9PLEO|nr:hypothetical protein CC86DRAFT_432320 [Ophiobolus disseminans]
MLPHLPLEIVLDIIASSVPSAPNALLNAAHPTTKLLLTFTLVSHGTRNLANRYLRQYCVYLDSEQRLGSFLRSIPAHPALRTITSLSLSPFQDDINNLPVCAWVRELLCYTSDTLRKLIIDIPLRTCYPEDDHLGVRHVLREGFDRLVNLEEFMSTQDELYLDTLEDQFAVVWLQWPKLKRLALWNVDADETFWRRVALHPSLQTLVLSSPDSIMEIDPKAEYLKHSVRSIRVLVSGSVSRRREDPGYTQNADWDKQDSAKGMRLYQHDFPEFPEDIDRGRQEHHDYIKRAAEDGTLWEAEYAEVISPTQLSTP